MLTGIEMMGCQNLAVPATVMRHVVDVESGANPFAIGVVGGRLARQPKNLDEAVATARMLEAKGYNFSVGIAQVNRANLDKQGLDTHEKAFDPCSNLAAGARILADCHASAGGDWGKAFSCYYSGDFVTGFEHGYVRKVYDSISRGSTVRDIETLPAAIPVRATARPAVSSSSTSKAAIAVRASVASDRIAIRSVAPDRPASASGIFVPNVRGPADGPPNSAPRHERSDPGTGAKDGAFVF